MKYAIVKQILFTDKQNIPWNDVEIYLKQIIGCKYIVEEYGDIIIVGADFPDEYAESKYTKKLRGALAKAKANAVQVISEMIQNARNRRWVENKDEKHNKTASRGWYRYDTGFLLPVLDPETGETRYNSYIATLIVRIEHKGLYLYDIINIKKEASTPL
ncbi:MAG: hypothetical protein IJM14_05540 [Lachnospiraceae bacterium]|nr:hypothetical protein [Lachnospiraceae bacterium]